MKKIAFLVAITLCFFYYNKSFSIDICEQKGFNGLVFRNNETKEYIASNRGMDSLCKFYFASNPSINQSVIFNGIVYYLATVGKLRKNSGYINEYLPEDEEFPYFKNLIGVYNYIDVNDPAEFAQQYYDQNIQLKNPVKLFFNKDKTISYLCTIITGQKDTQKSKSEAEDSNNKKQKEENLILEFNVWKYTKLPEYRGIVAFQYAYRIYGMPSEEEYKKAVEMMYSYWVYEIVATPFPKLYHVKGKDDFIKNPAPEKIIPQDVIALSTFNSYMNALNEKNLEKMQNISFLYKSLSEEQISKLKEELSQRKDFHVIFLDVYRYNSNFILGKIIYRSKAFSEKYQKDIDYTVDNEFTLAQINNKWLIYSLEPGKNPAGMDAYDRVERKYNADNLSTVDIEKLKKDYLEK